MPARAALREMGPSLMNDLVDWVYAFITGVNLFLISRWGIVSWHLHFVVCIDK